MPSCLRAGPERVSSAPRLANGTVGPRLRPCNPASEFPAPTADLQLPCLVQVCRAAGYYDHALYVAHAAHEPEWYLDILVDDCGKFDDALAYLQNLARQEAAAALKKHGKVSGRDWPQDCCIAGETWGSRQGPQRRR